VEKVSFFILNVCLNSILAFFTVILLIECVIFIFRIRQGRVAATLRMVPIIKLPLDLLLYDFSRWSYAQGINPLDCMEGTRTLSATCGWISSVTNYFPILIDSKIQLTVPGELTFTIADLIGYSIDPFILNVFTMIFISITSVAVIRRLFHYYRSFVTIDSLSQGSKPLNKKMSNSVLSSWVKRCRVKILTSRTLTGSPFVAGLISSTVYIPQELVKQFSRKEYEAVIAHEVEHVRYKDSLVRLILDLIGNVFWWVPAKWLRCRIEESQEIGCDLKCKAYGIDSTNLASAVCKSARYSKHNPSYIFANNLTKSHFIQKRISMLTQTTTDRFKKTRFIFTCLAIGIAFFVVLFGRFWIF
jgi:beta-lactamase regulating signal transducer with metallopeptidase domain